MGFQRYDVSYISSLYFSILNTKIAIIPFEFFSVFLYLILYSHTWFSLSNGSRIHLIRNIILCLIVWKPKLSVRKSVFVYKTILFNLSHSTLLIWLLFMAHWQYGMFKVKHFLELGHTRSTLVVRIVERSILLLFLVNTIL